MVGFTADFAGGELVIDNNEIESAFWSDRKHLPRIPEKLSISRALIDWWMETGAPGRPPVMPLREHECRSARTGPDPER